MKTNGTSDTSASATTSAIGLPRRSSTLTTSAGASIPSVIRASPVGSTASRRPWCRARGRGRRVERRYVCRRGPPAGDFSRAATLAAQLGDARLGCANHEHLAADLNEIDRAALRRAAAGERAGFRPGAAFRSEAARSVEDDETQEPQHRQQRDERLDQIPRVRPHPARAGPIDCAAVRSSPSGG